LHGREDADGVARHGGGRKGGAKRASGMTRVCVAGPLAVAGRGATMCVC